MKIKKISCKIDTNDTTRIYGTDRYKTAVEIARDFKSKLNFFTRR